MSRLIVKGLPANFTTPKLNSLFEKFGEITDCSLKFTKNGVFRRFAFVGFANDEDAKRASSALDNTFFGSSRLQVEECKSFGDQSKPRAWSKHSKDSSAYKRLHPEKFSEKEVVPEKKIKKVTDGEDQVFNEFLALNNKVKDFTNEEMNESVMVSESDLVVELCCEISGDQRFCLVLTGMPVSVKQKSIRDFLIPHKIKMMKIVRSSTESAALVTFFNLSDVSKVLQRSGQFIGGNKIGISRVAASEISELEGSEYNKTSGCEDATKLILETGRLFVRNLPYSCAEDDLLCLFKMYGEVADLQLIMNKRTKLCKGFAVVTYIFPENAVAAFSALDGSIFMGRMLHVLPGEEKRVKNANLDEKSSQLSSFKQEKLEKLKSNAFHSHSWNTLFLGANAVADTLASKLGVSKEEILSTEGETSAGVRLALAETRLVRETREFLISNGICLDSFSRPAKKRSESIILVKNLPSSTDGSEVRRMFEAHGAVKSFIMPPSGVTAIVEMDKVDAKKAMKALAYRRFRLQPLYLEWAPCDIFSKSEQESKSKSDSIDASAGNSLEPEGNPINEETKKTKKSKKHAKVEIEAKSLSATESFEKEIVSECVECEEKPVSTLNEHVLEPNTTVFVKNLNFNTTDEQLRQKFADRYKIFSANISKKRDPRELSKELSMGFGFVKFYREEDAARAMKEMQGALLDGHCMELKLSHRTEPEVFAARKTMSYLDQGDLSKMIVRNIPFQASRKELKQLFTAFGTIRSLRMPKKIGSEDGHRGFGFVDFVNKEDARRAFDSLVHSTHLYGRRLVLEWAKDEETVEELRDKAAANFRTDKKELTKQKKMLKNIEKDLTIIDRD